MSRACRDLFNSARACIEVENIDKAKELIEQAIVLEPVNKETISSAVGCFLYAELYSSARKAVENYEKQTGLKLPLEFTYEKIIQREQANLMVNDVPIFDLSLGSLRFLRLSDLQRGSLSSYVMTSTPVEEIEVPEHGITITQSRIKYSHAWNEITRASIVARIIFMGIYIGGKATQKICTLEVPGKCFQFDVSHLLPTLRKRCLFPLYCAGIWMWNSSTSASLASRRQGMIPSGISSVTSGSGWE